MNGFTYTPSHGTSNVLESELDSGLVLFLEPSVLELHGAENNAKHQSSAVFGTHPFLCCGQLGGVGLWIPTFSRSGPSRVVIPREQKRGSARWTSRPSYFHPEQRWIIRTLAVQEAAKAAGEMSSAGLRNHVLPQWLNRQMQSIEVDRG